MALDPLAQRAFGARADVYERHRPGWPADAVDRVFRGLGLGSEATVVDLAAGTGKLTRELVPRAGRVIAIEPSEDMRRQLGEVVPAADVRAGTAEEMPLGDAGVDAVFVAEAFHWFGTRAAVSEIARAVRPGGGLALLWNVHDFGNEEWVRAMGELLGSRRAPGVTPANRKQTGLWREAFEGAPFGPLEHYGTRQDQRTDAAGFVAHVSTWSFVGALDEEARAVLVRDLGELIAATHPTPHDIASPYRTEAYWARRL